MENLRTLQNEIVPFLRTRDYLLVRELGQGACGKTVLLLDDIIGEHFVCKKYFPYAENARQALFENFRREIKLLHQIHHPNLVRIFNYFLYPEKYAGYILMEFVDGVEIDQFAEKNPHKLDALFLQAIDGFTHLETCGVLHRDIRAGNLMVDLNNQLRIIDLGFGKQVETSADFEKSISLNWWCDTPKEFAERIYDFATEVYFVGKLFELLIQNNDVRNFRFRDVLRRMCSFDPSTRFSRFSEIQQLVRNVSFITSEFSEESKAIYRAFADSLTEQISKIDSGAGYTNDITKLIQRLDDVYRSVMLENWIVTPAITISCFITGTYYYRKHGRMEVDCLRDFVNLLRSADSDLQKIILANLHTRLDAVQRHVSEDEDIPF